MAHAIKQSRFKTFSKYDFVKSYVATAKDEKVRAEKELEAALIADAIEDNQNIVFENLATKDELQLGLKTLELSTKADIKALEYRLTIRLTAIMAALLTFLPLATGFIRSLFKF